MTVPPSKIIFGATPRARELRHKIQFQGRETVNPDAPDDLGNTESVFVNKFVVRAKISEKFGGEVITAARLKSEQPVNITVRQTTQTLSIKTDWRAVDVQTGKEYSIKSIADPDDYGEWLEILCKTGEAS